MSLIPYGFDRDPFFWPSERPHWPSRLMDHDFSLPLVHDDFMKSIRPFWSNDFYRPWRQLAVAARDLGSTIKVDDDKFQVNVDVQDFRPEEITVKTADGIVTVEGKHEEKRGYGDNQGYVARQFVRKYALPDGCRVDNVQSRLSSDGVLTVTAPRPAPAPVRGERSIPIWHTGPTRKAITDFRSNI